MKSLLFPLLLASTFAMPSIAATSQQSLAQASQLRDTAIRGHLGYDIVESLTVEVGPRIAGSSADARAVAWAEHKFNQLGFDNFRRKKIETKLRNIAKVKKNKGLPKGRMKKDTNPKGM